VNSAQRPLLEPLGECFIARLPDELLTEVLEYFAPAAHGFYPENFIRIPLVSQHWERIYHPILYREIDIRLSNLKTNLHTSKLIRSCYNGLTFAITFDTSISTYVMCLTLRVI